jgi:hypothetical protein
MMMEVGGERDASGREPMSSVIIRRIALVVIAGHVRLYGVTYSAVNLWSGIAECSEGSSQLF